MDRKLPALALALVLAACGRGADPMGLEADAPAVDQVVAPRVFLEENGGMFGNGSRDGITEAAADQNGGMGGSGGREPVEASQGGVADEDDTGYPGSGGRDSGEVATAENGGTLGSGGRSDDDESTTASNGGMFGNGN